METFIARQPIFDRNQKVYGYELLFRSGLENIFLHTNPDQASSKVIADSFLLFGLSKLTGGRRAFINVTEDILLEGYLHLFPKEFVVVEILENVNINSKVIKASEKLKKDGYLIALDDFVYEESYNSLLKLADFVKVDFLSTDGERHKTLIKDFSAYGPRFLAEKVETPLSFREAKILGYEYFQGYFFKKPDVLKSKDIPGFKLHYLRLLQEIHRPELDLKALEKIIKQDVSLSYKLLRYINSAYYNLPNQISSILQAIALLGEREIRKWCSFIALAHMGMDKPEELLMESILRAKFCESMAVAMHLFSQKEDLFLMGMFSLLDAFLDRPISGILEGLPINIEIKKALLGEKNGFRKVLDTFQSYQKGEWNEISEYALKFNIDEESISRIYWDSLKWTYDCFYSNPAFRR